MIFGTESYTRPGHDWSMVNIRRCRIYIDHRRLLCGRGITDMIIRLINLPRQNVAIRLCDKPDSAAVIVI